MLMSIGSLLQKMAITSVPHQTAADGSQYAVTTKDAAKVGHVNDNGNMNQKGEDQEVCT